MKQRILLVDDDLAVLLTLKAVLELSHYEVDTACSAAEALRCLKTGTYHLVISDSHMESEDAGVQVIRAAQAQSYHPATAMFSAEPPAGNDWKRQGSESVLIKPIGTEELIQKIQFLLAQHEAGKTSQRAASSPAGRHGTPSDANLRRKAS